MKRTTVKNITAERYGRLTVIARDGSTSVGKALWRCRCSCGKRVTASGVLLRNGTIRSCGCLASELTSLRSRTHGMTGTPEHAVWRSMRLRCLNPNEPQYKDWGGRGITICERWRDFANFYADMGRKPGPKYSIERKDVNGNYEPTNCIWLPRRLQSRNSRRVVLSLDAARTLMAMKRRGESIFAWAKEHGIKRSTAYRAANGETWI